MQADNVVLSAPQAFSIPAYKRSRLGTAALGALISSFTVVFGLGAFMLAPFGSRLIAALYWLGAWAITSLLTLPVTWLYTRVYRAAHASPRWELLCVSLVGLFPAAIVGFILMAAPGSGNVYE